MTKKKDKKIKKGGRVSPHQQLRKYALKSEVRVSTVLGLNEWNLYDAKSMVDEFVEMVAALPLDVDFAADGVVCPYTRVGLFLEWRRSNR